jgi:hypothetical protein
MTTDIGKLLDVAAITPVLADVGASGTRRPVWEPIASRSVLIAFDPDDREPPAELVGAYRDVKVVPYAVVAADDQDEVEFVLTEYPHSSSTLEPDLPALGDYAFRDYFRPVSRVRAPATSLNRVIDNGVFGAIDWIKLDSQGTDLRILASMRTELREAMMAVEVEPGFIDAYCGEDLYPEVHQFLKQDGYWLADLQLQQYARIRPESLDALRTEAAALGLRDPLPLLRKSPTAAEASYLRRLTPERTERELALLFVFAYLQGLHGFAWDCLCALRERTPANPLSETMEALMRAALERLAAAPRKGAPARPAAPPTTLAARVKRRLRSVLRTR